LKKHAKIHKKKFKCQVPGCDDACYTPELLELHVKNIHGDCEAVIKKDEGETAKDGSAPDGNKTKKVSRSDVIARKANNKGTEFCSVKKSSHSSCKVPGHSLLPGIKLDYEGVLMDVNIAKTEGFLLANTYMLRRCRDNIEIPRIDHGLFLRSTWLL
jgi:hypothetical protein